MKLRSVALISVFFLCQIAFGQKIKYKDLFPVLNSKNYAEGGPKLILYLADPKNQDEANPNLQMGLMLEDRFLKYDVVVDTTQLYATGDSAITFLDKAKLLITEKELKKNDQYYQAFFRRDLRTGEFGIKVSDVHLDIEKKIEAITQRVADAKSLHQTINSIESKHKLAMNAYKTLTEKFSSYNSMLLSLDQEDQELLTEIEQNGSEASEQANSIKESARKLGTEKYQEEVDLKTIVEFGTDGLMLSDIKSGSISIWDFENWANSAQSEIRGGVGIFKTQITNFSNEIREQKNKVKKSQDAEITLFPEELITQFEKYDPESTVEKLLRMEMHEARVIKQVDLQINPALLDSSLVGSQLEIYTAAKLEVDSLNLLVESILSEDLEEAKKKYPDYIDSFFKSHVTASKYVEEMRTWSRRNKNWIGKSVEYWAERNKWGIRQKEGEEEKQIPLFVQDSPENGNYTMGVLIETIPEVVIYGGDMEAGKGYVSSFGADRIEQWKIEYDLPGTEAFQYDSDTIPAAQGAICFYVYNKNAAENNFSTVSFTTSGQLKWAVNVTVSKAPVDFKFDDLTQELTILLYPEEDLPLDSDELGYVVIDRTGNAR